MKKRRLLLIAFSLALSVLLSLLDERLGEAFTIFKTLLEIIELIISFFA